jgi:hypothetical protein
VDQGKYMVIKVLYQLPHAERYSIYIDQKIKDRNHPDFLQNKMWKMRSKLYNLRSEIDELLK